VALAKPVRNERGCEALATLSDRLFGELVAKLSARV
jgi:hypothetical protein